jgi:hypothetical protein
MQLSKPTQARILSFPPIHRWPPRVKQIILGLAILACAATYLLFFGALLSAGWLFLTYVPS